jgi:NDP-sugar pyrophosphorylase family protein
MKAMILAAGLGTRLRPITEQKPKALVEVDGVSLLQSVIGRLKSSGVTEIIINLHHYPEQIREFLRRNDHFGIRIEYSPEEELLDTGGGLKKAAWFFDDGQPFFLHNVDILSDIDLQKMFAQHSSESCLATLAVKRRNTSRYFVFDENGQLCGWKSVKDNRVRMPGKPVGETVDLAFCGIHVISTDIFPLLKQQGRFSIVDGYLDLVARKEKIHSFRVDEYAWRDVGKISELT